MKDWLGNNAPDVVLAVKGSPQYTGITQHTSTQSVAIPIMWGSRRVAPNFIWQGQVPWTAAVGQASGWNVQLTSPTGGGNGFLPSPSGTIQQWSDNPVLLPGGWSGSVQIILSGTGVGFGASDFYGERDPTNSDSRWWVPAIMALGEGPINGIIRMWNGGGSTPMTVNWTGGVAPLAGPTYSVLIDPPSLFYTLFTGTSSQAVWGYIAYATAVIGSPPYTNQALTYRNTAYIASSIVDYGHGNTPPQQSFEVQRTPDSAFQATDSYGIGVDYSLADIIPDLLTNVQYGAGLSSGDIDSASLLLFKKYQFAQGLYFSPLLDSQNKVTDIIDRWAMVSNTWIYWSGSAIMFAPLGDEMITGNGQTFTPDPTPAYTLSNNDFIQPLQIDRDDPIDCFNRVQLEISDRFNDYAKNTLEWKDSTLIGQFDLRDANVVDGQDICDALVGAKSLELIGKRTAYIRNHYTMTLNTRFIRILPGTILAINEPDFGLVGALVRVVSIGEDPNGDLQVVAEEYPGTLGISRSRPTQTWSANPSTSGGGIGTPGTGGGLGTPTNVVTAPGQPGPSATTSWIEFTNAAGTIFLPSVPIAGNIIMFTHISNGSGNGGLLDFAPLGTPVLLSGNGNNVIDPQDKLKPATGVVTLHTSGMNFAMAWDGSVWRCVNFS